MRESTTDVTSPETVTPPTTGETGKPAAAFALSLIGGILFVIVGIRHLTAPRIEVLFVLGPDVARGLAAVLLGLSILDLVFGIIIIVGALTLYGRPRTARSWGVVILILSFLGLFAFGGILAAGLGFLGGVLGIIGGILAITRKEI
jgi:hypothetical protein